MLAERHSFLPFRRAHPSSITGQFSVHRCLLPWALLLIGLACHTRIAARAFHFPDRQQADHVKHLENYEISIPHLVSSNGTFITHRVSFSYSRHFSRRPTRQADHHKHDNLHYRFNFNQRVVHVELSPNRHLISPGLLIERRTKKYGNISNIRLEQFRKPFCHFIGSVRGDYDSKVALSTCNGLTGFIHSSTGQYFIEAVRGYVPGPDGRQPHILYNRTSLPGYLGGQAPSKGNAHQSVCGVVDENSDDITRERDAQLRKVRSVDEADEQSKHQHHRRRVKRSYSIDRYVETLLVVDSVMMEFYKNDDVEMYALTVMNMVSAIYHDVSIGNAINIVLVRLLLLEEAENDLQITHHADRTLNNFCKWQERINPKTGTHPNHHDVAVLVTRFNICSQKDHPCSTLGMAQVAGMCQSHRSCSVNQDTGLALAFTIAHELGHNFDMRHDEASNGCEAPHHIRQHVMSPQLVSDSTPLIWSNCSRASITKFLDRGWGFCLENEPKPSQFKFPVVPPGVMYDSDHQCRLQYGRTASHCEGIEEICTTLWCKVDTKCMTRLEAAVEGTYCDKKDKNKWCFEGQCSLITERMHAINGEWGKWSNWSVCSRTCGAGVSNSIRHCDNPVPSNGGKYCIGERKRFRICDTEACPETDISFRQTQCTEFNKVPYKNKLYTWDSIFTLAKPCQLHCKPNNQFFSVVLRDLVKDGTPCRVGHRDMCISGRCMKVDCDWGLDSGAKEDRCGVCHGDGSTCTTVKEKYTEKQGLGYVQATVIPKDARNIRVEEVADANNYLALRNQKGEYFLNGHWYIQWSGDYDAAGTVIHYERRGNKESFSAPGPLKEPLYLMLLFQSPNPGITYEYTVPNHNVSNRRRVFSWIYTDWSHCTSSCGGGVKRRRVLCTEPEAGTVDDTYCAPKPKPDDMLKACNKHICPAKWWTGPWQHCSVTCGDNGVRRRTVICVRSIGSDEQMALDDVQCKKQEIPRDTKACRGKPKCPEWIVGSWSQTCHGDPCAIQKRSVSCSQQKRACNGLIKPKTSKQCGDVTCGHWTVGPWSRCTRLCEVGVQVRLVRCVLGSTCSITSRPVSQRYCNSHTCTERPPTTVAPTTVPPTTVASTTVALPTVPLPRQAHVYRTAQDINSARRKKTPNRSTNPDITAKNSAPKSTGSRRTTSNEGGADKTSDNHLPTATTTRAAVTWSGTKGEANHRSGVSDSDVIGQTGVGNTRRKDNSANTVINGAQTSYSPVASRQKAGGHERTQSSRGGYNKERSNQKPWSENPEKRTQKPPEYVQRGPTRRSDPSTSIISPYSLTVSPFDAIVSPYATIVSRHGSTVSPFEPTVSPYDTTPRTRNANPGEKLGENETGDPNEAGGENAGNDVTTSKGDPNEADGENAGNDVSTRKGDPNEAGGENAGNDVSKRKFNSQELTDFMEPYKGNWMVYRGSKLSRSSPFTKYSKSGEKPIHEWTVSNWNQCSRFCGGGSRTRRVICVNVLTRDEVQTALCGRQTKPSEQSACNHWSCFPWSASDWSSCSVSCGGVGVQRRIVYCKKPNHCDVAEKPTAFRTCYAACQIWVAGSWSQCSASCGGGEQARHVLCVNKALYEPASGCNIRQRPLDERLCNTKPCVRRNAAALTDWDRAEQCKSDQMTSHVCGILKRMGHCRQRYVQIKCCRTCHHVIKTPHPHIVP